MSGLLAGDPHTVAWLMQLLAALAVGITLSVSFLLLHHATTIRRERRRRARITAAAEQLAPHLAASRPLGDAVTLTAVEAAVRAWGRAAVATVLRRSRRMLAGDPERAMSALLEAIGESRRLARLARFGGALRRGRTLRRLAGCGGTLARRELLRAAADRRPELRRVAREGLLELRDPFAASAALSAFLDEPRQSLSWSRAFFLRLAVYAPGDLRRLTAGRTLAPELEKLALEALAETGNAAAARLALVGVRSPTAELRAAGVRLLGSLGDRRWAPLLAALLEDPEWFVRAAAARALGEAGHEPGTLEALDAGLTDLHWWVRSNAARSLARMGPAGMNRLARAATTGHGWAREAALPELLRLADSPPPPPHDEAATRDLAPPLDDGATRKLAAAS